jgi:hypothetical protein
MVVFGVGVLHINKRGGKTFGRTLGAEDDVDEPGKCPHLNPLPPTRVPSLPLARASLPAGEIGRGGRDAVRPDWRFRSGRRAPIYARDTRAATAVAAAVPTAI